MHAEFRKQKIQPVFNQFEYLTLTLSSAHFFKEKKMNFYIAVNCLKFPDFTIVHVREICPVFQ